LSVILDAGALIAVERADRATAAVIEVARQEHRGVFVPAGVVGQVWRGGARQARVARLPRARAVFVEPLTDVAARAAGILCGAAGTADVIDASVVSGRAAITPRSSTRTGMTFAPFDPMIPVVDC